ncbi:MAG: TonB-dependent receptor plug domain-containing protein [Gemmatimonadetes bacterium]|nr:TonB-dependent receptor plug domain-containing protein [Gemmatimonadota bacterium]
MDSNTVSVGRWANRDRPRIALLVLFAAIALAAAVSARTLEAQETPQEGETVRLTARVYDPASEVTVPGAVIVLTGMDGRYVTDADGRAVIDVPAGRYWVSVRRWGYDRLTGHLDVIHVGDVTLYMEKTRDIDVEAPGTLLVRVVDGVSGDPIVGAVVSLAEGQSRLSDMDGLAVFGDLRDPVVRFEVEATGYGQRAAPVALSPDRTTAARVEMMVETAAPRPIETEIRSLHMAGDGIHDNMNRYGKRTNVVTRPMLDELAPAQLTDVFRQVPGIRVGALVSGSPHLYLGQCNQRVSLYLDGFRRRTDLDVQRRLFIDDIAPESVELIEIWQRRRNRSCGGWVLIWTTRQGVG